MIKSFIDSGVLIYAARGVGELAEKSLSILEDSNREFASSIFLKLEVLPKAIYHQNISEIKFYETYFESVFYWEKNINKIIELASTEMGNNGLGAMDALHISAAKLLNVDEFITNEKPNKSIHRTQHINIISLYDL